MQLSVPRYQAIAVGRGATLDTIDVPLNNRLWLESAVRGDPHARHASRLGCASIDAIVELDQSRPGRLLRRPGRPAPPAAPGPGLGLTPTTPPSARSPLTGFDPRPAGRWPGAATPRALYDAPLQMHYTGLDRDGAATSSASSTPATASRRRSGSTADESIEVHPLLAQARDLTSRSSSTSPPRRRADGDADLTWTPSPAAAATAAAARWPRSG